MVQDRYFPPTLAVCAAKSHLAPCKELSLPLPEKAKAIQWV